MFEWLTFAIGAADRIPAWQVGLTLLMPASIGMVLFVVFMERESHGWSTKLKYLGLIPPLIGIIVCWRFTSGALGFGELGEFYREWYGIGGRGIMLHYAAVPVQIAAMVVMVVWGLKHDRHAGVMM